MKLYGTTTLQSVEGTGLRFEARFASGLAMPLDSGPEPTAPNPVLTLIAAIATCGAMDVISILRKKRVDVTAYEVVMHADRQETHPKRLTAVELVHRVTGRGVPPEAVAEAVHLSATKYCSVRHTLDPELPVTERIEVLEA